MFFIGFVGFKWSSVSSGQMVIGFVGFKWSSVSWSKWSALHGVTWRFGGYMNTLRGDYAKIVMWCDLVRNGIRQCWNEEVFRQAPVCCANNVVQIIFLPMCSLTKWCNSMRAIEWRGRISVILSLSWCYTPNHKKTCAFFVVLWLLSGHMISVVIWSCHCVPLLCHDRQPSCQSFIANGQVLHGATLQSEKNLCVFCVCCENSTSLCVVRLT